MHRLLTGLILGLSVAAATQAEEQPFYLTIDTPPAPELSPADALASFTLAPGFDIELVASEPLIEDPVAVTWDERGRLYAVEMRGYMPDAYGKGEKEPVGYVVRLSDTDADGTFDQREVLLDKLVLPRALAIVNEGLLVGEPPNFWLCPSSAGRADDIDCSAKRRLGVYGDQPGSAEHAENGLIAGLDNWLYSAKSKRRLRVRNGELEEEPTLFRGQWGIAQDNAGRIYYNTNSNLLLGDSFDAQQIVAAGNRSAPGLGERISMNDQLFAVRVNTGVNRAYVPGVLREDGRLNRPTSASGMTAYRGDQFPAGYGNDVFVAEPAANALVHLRLTHDGLQSTAEHVLYDHAEWGQVEFLASTDERFRPVDAAIGPDGALYVIDMYRGIIQDHVFLSDELRAQALARSLDKPVGMGRLWRVRAQGAEPLRPATDLGAASTQELVALLGHPNVWQRETAQRLLIGRQERGLDRRLRQVIGGRQALQSVHGLWTLAGREALDRRTVRKALAQPAVAVQLAAIRAGAQVLKRGDLLGLVNEQTDPVLLQQAVLSLAAHNQHANVQAQLLEVLLAKAQDRYLPAAIRAAVHRQERSFLQALAAGGGWNAEREQQTGFVQALVLQGFRADPDSADELLSFAKSQNSDARWMQIAILDGLYDRSREPGFERVALQEAHALFATQEEALWPAVARARRAVTWPGDDLASDAKPLLPIEEQRRQQGAAFYAARCANCHGDDGKGIASLAPPLADSIWVTGPSERLARILLHGMQGPVEVAGVTWDGVMPGHGALPEFDDTVASGLMTYLHRAWGHAGRAIAPGFVASIRAQTADRRAMWTVPELLALDTNTHYQRYVGRYGGPGFGFGFIYNGSELEVRSGIFNGPLVEQKEDHFLFEPRDLRLEFVQDDSDRVVALRMPTDDGEVLMPRLQD